MLQPTRNPKGDKNTSHWRIFLSRLLPTLQHMYPFPFLESFKVGGWEGECSNPQVPVCTHSTPQAHPTYLTLSPQPKVCHDLVLRLEHTGC